MYYSFEYPFEVKSTKILDIDEDTYKQVSGEMIIVRNSEEDAVKISVGEYKEFSFDTELLDDEVNRDLKEFLNDYISAMTINGKSAHIAFPLIDKSKNKVTMSISIFGMKVSITFIGASLKLEVVEGEKFIKFLAYNF